MLSFSPCSAVVIAINAASEAAAKKAWEDACKDVDVPSASRFVPSGSVCSRSKCVKDR